MLVTLVTVFTCEVLKRCVNRECESSVIYSPGLFFFMFFKDVVFKLALCCGGGRPVRNLLGWRPVSCLCPEEFLFIFVDDGGEFA